MQSSLSIIISEIKIKVVWSQNILSYNLAIWVGGPMNGSAFRIVERGQRYFVFKVKENINLIVLGCEMKGI